MLRKSFADIAVLDQVEPIHPAVVDRPARILPVVADVAGHSIRVRGAA